MGLPPAQGHNNLRLNPTTNYYPRYRLDTTQYNKTRKPKQTFYTHSLHPSIAPCLHSRHSTMERHSSSNRAHRLPAQKASAGGRCSRRASYDSQATLSSSHSVRLRKFHRNRSCPPANPIISRELKKYISSSDEPRNHYRPNSFPNIPHFSLANMNVPIVSNMPLVDVNSSIVMVNTSPFGLRDPRVGILHHCAQSISYF